MKCAIRFHLVCTQLGLFILRMRKKQLRRWRDDIANRCEEFRTNTNHIEDILALVAILNMLSGFCATDENKILLLRSMGASKLQILTKLVVPSSLPAFVSMLKINVGMAWIGSIMGEYIVSKAGIGYLIVYGGQVFKLDLVMASVIVLCVLAAGMYAVVAAVEKICLKSRGS